MDISTLLSRMADSTNVSRAFGTPYERGDTTVIPTAFVIGGGGGGMSDEMPEGATTPGGSGGGYFSVSWPLGAYVVHDGDVRWVPAIDPTRIAIAALGIVKLALKVRRRSRG